jgi:hypothetical protein
MTVEFKDRRIGLADSYGTTAEVSVYGDDGETSSIQLRVAVGQCGGSGWPTPAAARQLAAALLDAAEAAEASS